MTQRTVLLVDDDEDILTLYRLALKRKSDWNIFSATDGPTALAQADQCRPNLVVLDVMLPGGMSGIDVCQQLCSSQAASAQVPVVMLSALNDPATHQSAYVAGAREFWTKPVSPVEFVKRLEELMVEADSSLVVPLR